MGCICLGCRRCPRRTTSSCTGKWRRRHPRLGTPPSHTSRRWGSCGCIAHSRRSTIADRHTGRHSRHRRRCWATGNGSPNCLRCRWAAVRRCRRRRTPRPDRPDRRRRSGLASASRPHSHPPHSRCLRRPRLSRVVSGSRCCSSPPHTRARCTLTRWGSRWGTRREGRSRRPEACSWCRRGTHCRAGR